MNKDKILELINTSIDKISKEFDINLNKKNDKIFVYGENGNFDSMMLVVLLAEIEEDLLLNYKKEVSLTSDKAMAKTTPFESNISILDLIIESLN